LAHNQKLLLVYQKAASQAQEAWKGLLSNKTQQLLMLGKALLKEEHALTKEVQGELQFVPVTAKRATVVVRDSPPVMRQPSRR
jgi:hypothetical protein